MAMTTAAKPIGRRPLVRAVFAIPGAIETPTGGYKYDREVLARLGDHDVDCRHLELPGGFPFPDPTAVDTALARIGTFERDAVLLIDGLAFGALPTERLLDALPARTVALVHHPLGY